MPFTIEFVNWLRLVIRMDKIIERHKIEELAKRIKSEGKKVVTINGSFDIMHLGHVKMLQEAKKQGDVLIVGLNSDTSIKAYKSKYRPINNQQARVEFMASLECVDYIFILATIGILIVGLLFDQYNWSAYVFFGAIGVAGFSIFYSAIDGVQLLFGGRNTFLVSQSAPKGIRKMLIGKVMQMLYSYSIEYICLFILLMVFQTNKLHAFLMSITIVAATFNGLTLGLLSLSIAPFFETSDIASNPLRGLQLTLPLNISFVITGAIVVGFYYAFWPHLSWLLFLLLFLFELLSGIGYLFLADKLFQRFQP